MNLHKKYYLAVLIAFGSQFFVGVSFAFETMCYEAYRKYCSADRTEAVNEQCRMSKTELSNAFAEQYDHEKARGEWMLSKHADSVAYYRDRVKDRPTARFYFEYKICREMDQKSYHETGGRSKSNTTSTQSSNAGASSIQSNSNQSNSESSIESYQSLQQAHNQANAGKGKKRNAQAEVPECIKPNSNRTHFINGCKFSVNISYCFAGAEQGAEGFDSSLLKDLSCQNQKFANLELSPGEEITGNYNGLSVAAMVCKAPSQPLDMNFDGTEALGRCTF